MMNAHNIANITAYSKINTNGDLQKAEELIDQLATLYGIKGTSTTHVNLAAEVMDREYKNDPKENGASYTMAVHNQFKEQSLDQLFFGKKPLMTKGYTKELYNPDISIQLGTAKDKDTMFESGFNAMSEDGTPLGKDISDLNPDTLVLYVSKVSGLNTKVSTISSQTSRTAAGTDLFRASLDAGSKTASIDSIVNVTTVKAKNAFKAAEQFNSSTISAKNRTSKHLVPIVNDKGEIVNYRYLMTENMKDNMLEKNNNFSSVLGAMHGSIVDKVESKDINKQVIELAYDDYKKNFKNNGSQYVRIAKNSADPRYKEIFNLMPTDMKQDMKNVWGKNEIYIKEDLIDLIFGFRKLSLSDSKYVKLLSGSKYGKFMRLDMHLKLAGRIWQEVVGIAKDNIVIKSYVVLQENVISNNFLLWVKGVPIKDIAGKQATALAALDAFQKELTERDKLQRRLDVTKHLTPGAKKQIQGRINTLQANLDANPVKELIDEGIFQNIVEDINPDENNFGIKKQLEDFVDPIREKYIPNVVTEVFKQAYLTKDTFIYKKLLQATQYSDFVARYTLYQHNLTKKGMSKQEALLDIVETFINYDVPTSPELQWLNDMGFLMFTKFLFRIQKVIFKLIKDNPANALALHALQRGFGEVSDITDSNLVTTSLFGRIRNSLTETPADASYIGGYEFWQRVF